MFKHSGKLPPRIAALPRDARGYPVPWFVAWIDGAPDFRVADTRKFTKALRYHLCWVCGEDLGRNHVFVLGPMCTITRTTSEPPCHLDCARFSVQHCPFLTLPRAKRREANLPEEVRPPGGFHLDRNPGVVALWVTRQPLEIWRAPTGHSGLLLTVGYPEQVYWYAEGREATFDEVRASIDAGIPALRKLADTAAAERELNEQIVRALQYLPLPHEYAVTK